MHNTIVSYNCNRYRVCDEMQRSTSALKIKSTNDIQIVKVSGQNDTIQTLPNPKTTRLI